MVALDTVTEVTPLEATLKALTNLLNDSGYFEAGVTIGELDAYQGAWSASLTLGPADVEELTLNSGIELRHVFLQITAALGRDNEHVEFQMARIYDGLRQLVAADFDLSTYQEGTTVAETGVREVDLFQMGMTIDTVPQVGSSSGDFRQMTIDIPLRVQDAWTTNR